jgi:heme-degrading monooxygenase HmoA
LSPGKFEDYGLGVTERVVRMWRGYGSAQEVKRYCDKHFVQTVLPQLRGLTGFVGATVLIRGDGAETELVVQTTWESIDAIKAFAGEDLERAVVEPIVSEILTRFDDHVVHYSIALTE